MGDTFQCAKCGAKYARERRRVGRAVVCSCGHKFLVPPADEGPPAVNQPAMPRRGDGRRPTGDVRGAADDSSGEVLPLAEVVAMPASPQDRWAEPIAAGEALPEAEIVYASPVEPARPSDDMFAMGGAYPLNTAEGPAVPRRPMLPAAKTAKPRGARRKDREQSTNVTDVIANVVLFVLLPISALFFVAGLLQYTRLGRLFPDEPPRVAPQQADFNGGLPDQPSTRRDAIGAQPILVVRVTKQAASDDFTMEYEVRHGSLNATNQYIWIVSAAQGRIEFPMSALAAGPGRISGRSAQPSGLSPPFTAYIEEQSAGGRRRVSNEVAVAVGG